MRRTDKISAGMSFIDEEQGELTGRLENLRTAIRKQVCRYTIENTIAFLEEYSEVHFCEEERYMRHFGYPDYRSHKAQHEQFVVELHFLKEELCNIKTLGLRGSYELSVETIHLIVDWITGHVMKDDRKLFAFLRENRIGNDYLALSGCGPENRVDGGTVTICSICKKILGDKGIWKMRKHFNTFPHEGRFSRGLCPECLQEYYADLFQEKR